METIFKWLTWGIGILIGIVIGAFLAAIGWTLGIRRTEVWLGRKDRRRRRITAADDEILL